MVVPHHIRRAAADGDIAVVETWLAEVGPEAINETDEYGNTLLRLSLTRRIEESHVQFARRLIARGADVNIASNYDSAALHMACYPGGCASAMVSLLLQAGARVNVRNIGETTPLGTLIKKFNYGLHYVEDEDSRTADQRQVSRSGLEIMKLLLKGGASLDRCERDRSAEAAMQDFLSRHRSYANDEYFAKGRERSRASARTAVTRPMCGSRTASFSACALCSSGAAPRSGAAPKVANVSSASRACRTVPAGTCSRTSGKLRD